MRRLAWCAVGCVLSLSLVSAWTLSLNPKAWTKDGSGTLGSSSGALTITLPTWPSALYYAWTIPPGPLTGSLTMSVQMVTTGTPLFVWDTNGNVCPTPATTRPFFGRWSQRRRRIEFADRWWPNGSSYVLGPGQAVLSVPLERSLWTGVQFTGLPDDQAFALAASDPDLVGVSFGGGCFYGHGVGVQGGTATLIIDSLTVS